MKRKWKDQVLDNIDANNSCTEALGDDVALESTQTASHVIST